MSHEHSGFTFQAEPSVAAEMLSLHSGGKCSEALLLAQDLPIDGDKSLMASSSSQSDEFHSNDDHEFEDIVHDGETKIQSTTADTAPATITTTATTSTAVAKEEVVITTATTSEKEISTNTGDASIEVVQAAPSVDSQGDKESVARRRSKREKATTAATATIATTSTVVSNTGSVNDNAILIPPKAERKGLFCCFGS
jgi:hypothetical protein